MQNGNSRIEAKINTWEESWNISNHQLSSKDYKDYICWFIESRSSNILYTFFSFRQNSKKCTFLLGLQSRQVLPFLFVQMDFVRGESCKRFVATSARAESRRTTHNSSTAKSSRGRKKNQKSSHEARGEVQQIQSYCSSSRRFNSSCEKYTVTHPSY